MAVKDFASIVAPSDKPHDVMESPLQYLIKNTFKLETLAVIGALVQIALFTILPYRVALLPAVAWILNAIVKTSIQMQNINSNAFMDGVKTQAATAQLPSIENGEFGHEVADKPVVVFHFGVRFNHPLGVLAPGALKSSEYFQQCMKDITDRREEFGMLGHTTWVAGERASNNTIMYVFYFRDVQGLHKFAHEDIHTRGAEWYFKSGIKHISFFHETFSVPRKAYESIYFNCPPLLMGATTVKCPDEEGNERYVQPMVGVEKNGPLSSMYRRMGKMTA